MIEVTPAIQGPSPEVLAKLLKVIEAKNVDAGPAFCWDPQRKVFVMAVVEQGVIVHWQIEPARDAAEAEALKRKYVFGILTAMCVAADQLPPDQRATLDAMLADIRAPRH